MLIKLFIIFLFTFNVAPKLKLYRPLPSSVCGTAPRQPGEAVFTDACSFRTCQSFAASCKEHSPSPRLSCLSLVPLCCPHTTPPPPNRNLHYQIDFVKTSRYLTKQVLYHCTACSGAYKYGVRSQVAYGKKGFSWKNHNKALGGKNIFLLEILEFILLYIYISESCINIVPKIQLECVYFFNLF